MNKNDSVEIENLTLLENLKPSSFKNQDDDCVEILGAIFLTYSIDCKTILSALISMFAYEQDDNCDENSENEEKNAKKDIIRKWEYLIKHGMNSTAYKEKTNTDDKWIEVTALQHLQEHVAFVCNDGYDKSSASPIYWYTKNLTYYFKPEAQYSFHPKLFIVKFRREEQIYFRFMIGSMNLVNSKSKEFITVFDLLAYDTEKNDERVSGDILTGLLNLQWGNGGLCSSPNINGGNTTKLGTVINNLGLRGLFFEKKDLSRVICFLGGANKQKISTNSDGIKDELKKAEKIISPFLTKGMVEDIVKKNNSSKGKDSICLYTMESELKKIGYSVLETQSVDSGDNSVKQEDATTFYVYSVSRDKPFSHIKMYVTEDAVYTGSLNFTQSAFTKNKEILFKVDKSQKFDKYLNDYLGTHYEEKPFYYENVKDTSELDEQDVFREVAMQLSGILCQEIDVSKCKGRLLVKSDGIYNVIDNVQKLCKMIKPSSDTDVLNKKNIKVKIIPFGMSKEKVSIDLLFLEEDIKNIPVEWELSNKLQMTEMYSFCFYKDDSLAAQFQYQVNTKYIDIDEQSGDIEQWNETAMEMMFVRLNKLLDNESTTDKIITHESKAIENGYIRNDVVGFIRKSLPTLENLLRQNMDDDVLKIIDFEEKVALIEKMTELSSKATNEEKQDLGFGQFNQKVLDNLLEQSRMLLEELNCKKS